MFPSNKSVQPSRFTHCNLSANVASTGYRQKSQPEARTDGSLMFWMKLLILWPSKHKPRIISSTKKLARSVAETPRQAKISDRLPWEDLEQD